VATGLNTIEIFDENYKRNETFINLDQKQYYNKGDYIRIYYYPQNVIVARIVRMTVLEYKVIGQNLGNIYHKTTP